MKNERAINPAKHAKSDRWDFRAKGGNVGGDMAVPHGEPPICCPESKQPTPQPVADPWNYKKGARKCEEKTGGCGAVWTPPQEKL